MDGWINREGDTNRRDCTNCTKTHYTKKELATNLPGQDLGHAAMRHPQLPRDVTRPNTVVSQLHYSLPYNVRQRPAVHKNATQLVHTTMALNNKTVISLTACQTSCRDAIFEGITGNGNIHTAVHTTYTPRYTQHTHSSTHNIHTTVHTTYAYTQRYTQHTHSGTHNIHTAVHTTGWNIT